MSDQATPPVEPSNPALDGYRPVDADAQVETDDAGREVPTQLTDIDPQTGQSIGNKSEGDPETPPTAAPPEPASDDGPPQTFKDQDPRKGIYEKARENRGSLSLPEEQDLTTKVMVRKAQMEAEGLGIDQQKIALLAEFPGLEGDALQVLIPDVEIPAAPADPQAAAPATPPVTPADPAAPATPAPADPQTPVAEPTATPPAPAAPTAGQGGDEFVTLQVEGREQFATLAEVQEAGGVENLQKQRAADYRLEQAAIKDRLAEASRLEAKRLEEEAAAAAAEASATPVTPPPGGSNGQPAPSNVDLESRVDELADKLLSGDEAATKEALREVLTRGPEPAPAPTATEPAPSSAPVEPAATPAPTLSQEQIEANAYTKAKYSNLVTPDVLPYLRERLTFEQSLDTNTGKPMTELIDQAAAYVSRVYVRPKIGEQDAPILPPDEVRQRIAAKRSTTPPTGAQPAGGPTATQTVAPPKTEQQKRSEAVEKIAAGRGQRIG